MKKLTIAITSILILAGCKDVFTTQIETKNVFQPNESAFVLKKGNNTISGNAFLRQKGGGVVTCAGSEVKLLPVTNYSKERIDALYAGSNYTSSHNLTWVKFVPEAPQDYYNHTKTTTCNSSGDFEFKNIPNGKYYIQTNVVWHVANSAQGGGLVSTVDVKNGEHAEIIMSR